MTANVIVICEARADFLLSSELADRLICEKVAWIETELLDSFRKYLGLEGEESFTAWSRVAILAREANLRIRGHFDGEPAAPDAHAARRAIHLALRKIPTADAILLVRDDDAQTSRRRGLEQARNESPVRDRIIIGVAHCKRECWVLAGFVCENQDESNLLTQLRQQLGFNPCQAAENLAAKHFQDLRSAKRVLAILTSDDNDREAKCWRETSFDVIRQQGIRTGVVEFLDEVNDRLVPLITGRAAGT